MTEAGEKLTYRQNRQIRHNIGFCKICINDISAISDKPRPIATEVAQTIFPDFYFEPIV